MSKTKRKQHEKEFLRKLQNMFSNVQLVESFENETLYSVEFGDGVEQQVTLHFDEE